MIVLQKHGINCIITFAWIIINIKFQRDSEFLICKIKMEEDTDLYAAFLLRIFEELNKFQDIEVFCCFQLLRFLSNKFDSIVQSIFMWPTTNLKLDKILT